MKTRYLPFLATIILTILSHLSKAQLLSSRDSYTRGDTLRGTLSALRSCYDVSFYHLDITIDPKRKSVRGSNLFRFSAIQDFSRLQLDLFANLKIEKIEFKGRTLPFTREYNAVYVDLGEELKKGVTEELRVYYSGKPVIAKNPPWDGGFTFTKTGKRKRWVAVSCQGLGASSWWPCKDHQSDEPDSMLISVSVPSGLTDISNGRLRSSEKLANGYTRYNWFVSYPLNSYNATVNISDFAHFSDVYDGEGGKLTLDYYVLPENAEKARQYLNNEVKPMLRCFEHWFGPYPFYRDGYKLVEAPYLGMEHQSAVAYGNDYHPGYRGTDLSGTGLGLTWDYIIVHESGHEWFGNNITSKDIADMWIHEAFTTYSEGLYVECGEGKEAGAQYIRGERKAVLNDRPVIGPYGVNKEGSGDMYFKGANMLHTIRSVINDDEKWRQILRGLNKTFGLKTVTTPMITDYICKAAGINLLPVFEQYLKYTSLPVLEIKRVKGSRNSVNYRWKADAQGFNMPVKVKFGQEGEWFFIEPKEEWQSLELPLPDTEVQADTDNFYINTNFP